jgi:hypothetical protein
VFARVAAAKAVLVPSTWDVFNLTAAEAMGLARPVIVSDCAGAADLIESGVNGFLFRSGDPVALADRVRTLQALGDDGRRAMGEAAARTVRAALAPDTIAGAKLDLYRREQSAARSSAAWLRDSLLPRTTRSRHMFLDSLPLKQLAVYVARRGLHKVLPSRMAPILERMGGR